MTPYSSAGSSWTAEASFSIRLSATCDAATLVIVNTYFLDPDRGYGQGRMGSHSRYVS